MSILQFIWWTLVFTALGWGVVYACRNKIASRELIQVLSFGAIAVPVSIMLLLVVQQFLPYPERNLVTIITLERVGLGGSLVIISYATFSAGIGLLIGTFIRWLK